MTEPTPPLHIIIDPDPPVLELSGEKIFGHAYPAL
jgi:hypothetical protein